MPYNPSDPFGNSNTYDPSNPLGGLGTGTSKSSAQSSMDAFGRQYAGFAPGIPTAAPGWQPLGPQTNSGLAAPGPAQYPPAPAAPGIAPATSPAVGEGTLSGPGALEQTWDTYGSNFFDPSMLSQWYTQNSGAFDAFNQRGDQFWNQLQGQFNYHPATTNRADEAYQAFVDATPDFGSIMPTFGGYYDHAADELTQRFGDEAAARGLLGSSAAYGEMGNALADLQAEEANRRGDFDLQRIGLMNNWFGTGGALGQGADASARANEQLGLERFDTLGRLGMANQQMGLGALLGEGSLIGDIDKLDLNNLVAGFGAAGAAQGAEQDRERGALSDLSGVFGLLSNLSGDTYDSLFGTDMDLLDAILGGDIAGNKTALDADLRDREGFIAELSSLIDAFKSGKEAGLV